MDVVTPRSLTSTALGSQRDWGWRGWQVRYTFLRAVEPRVEAPPILLLHGFGSSLSQWQANLQPLSQHNTVYALDLLGFGASEKAPAAYDVAFWVEQVHDFWRSLIHTPIIIVGHSLGAAVALAAAAKYPDMAERLVLLTLPPARQELISGKMVELALGAERMFTSPLILGPVFALVRSPRLIRAVLRGLVYHNRDFVTDNLVNTFLTPILDRDAARVFYRLAKSRTRTDYSPEIRVLLPQVQRPILLLWGERDRVVPLVQGVSMPDLNPQLRLVVVPDGGHCLYDECADCVNQEILTWIGQA